MRCHAGTCTDPDSLSPEDAVDDGGMPAHPQCATYADEPTDAGRYRTVRLDPNLEPSDYPHVPRALFRAWQEYGVLVSDPPLPLPYAARRHP